MRLAFWLIWATCLISLLVTIGLDGSVQVIALHVVVAFVLSPFKTKISKFLKNS